MHLPEQNDIDKIIQEYDNKLKVLRKELEQTTKNLAILENLYMTLQSTLQLDEILKIIVNNVTESTGFKTVLLSLVDKSGKQLVRRAAAGVPDDAFSKLRQQPVPLSAAKELMKEKYQLSKSYYIRYIHKEKVLEKFGYFPPGEPQEDIKDDEWHPYDILIVPLTSKEGVFLGIMSVDSPVDGKIPDKPRVNLLEALASSAGLAIENAHLYERTKELAITDGLTGLYNYRYFMERLDEEIKRANRYLHPLSLMMIDLDGFKNFNDTYGHTHGDNLLRRFSGILNQTIREVDFVARYGGDEFIVVLPETDVAETLRIGERIRCETLRSNKIKSNPIPNGKITISLGAASYPRDAKTKEELIKKADQAMYRAKEQGGNRICAYREIEQYQIFQLLDQAVPTKKNKHGDRML